MICFDQYLEGANLPGCCKICQQYSYHQLPIPKSFQPSPIRTSGILYLCSLSALTLHIMAVSPSMTPMTTAVLAFQFFG
jgi:hypothetical protein